MLCSVTEVTVDSRQFPLEANMVRFKTYQKEIHSKCTSHTHTHTHTHAHTETVLV